MSKLCVLLKNRWTPYFLGAVLMRFLCMPFFGHTDIFNTYRRAASVAFDGVSIFALNEQLIHGIQAVWLYTLSIVLGREQFANIHESVLAQGNLNSLLFLFKFLYLLFEIGFWFVLFRRLVKINTVMILIVLFNPIVLFATYVFGRYDVIVCLAIVMLLWAIKAGGSLPHVIIANSALLLLRPSMLLLMPIVLLLRRSFAQKIMMFVIPVCIYGTTLVINKILGGGVAEWLVGGSHTGYFFQMNFVLGKYTLYVFFMLLGFFVLWFAYMYFSHEKGDRDYILTVLGGYTIFAIYYATSNFHPQYFMWILPLSYVLIDRYQNKTLIVGFVAMSTLYLGVQASLSPTFFSLFFPISKVFAEIPMYEFMYKIANISKSMLSGVLIAQVLILIRLYEKK